MNGSDPLMTMNPDNNSHCGPTRPGSGDPGNYDRCEIFGLFGLLSSLMLQKPPPGNHQKKSCSGLPFGMMLTLVSLAMPPPGQPSHRGTSCEPNRTIMGLMFAVLRVFMAGNDLNPGCGKKRG